jgi:hypothetical protein
LHILSEQDSNYRYEIRVVGKYDSSRSNWKV